MGVTGCPRGVEVAGGVVATGVDGGVLFEQPAVANTRAAATAGSSNLRVMADHPQGNRELRPLILPAQGMRADRSDFERTHSM